MFLNSSSVPFGVNFGYAVSSDPYTLYECPPVNPLVGCKDPSFLEYNSLAETHDPSFCLTLAVPGCLDTTAFNYDPLANTMDLVSNCDYTLQLFDGGNDGWNNSYETNGQKAYGSQLKWAPDKNWALFLKKLQNLAQP